MYFLHKRKPVKDKLRGLPKHIYSGGKAKLQKQLDKFFKLLVDKRSNLAHI